MKKPHLVFLLLLFIVGLTAQAQDPLIKSVQASSDFALSADPEAKDWKDVKGVFAALGPLGKVTPGFRTELR